MLLLAAAIGLLVAGFVLQRSADPTTSQATVDAAAVTAAPASTSSTAHRSRHHHARKLGAVGRQRAAEAKVHGWIRRSTGGHVRARGWVRRIVSTSPSGAERTETQLVADNTTIALASGGAADRVAVGTVVELTGTLDDGQLRATTLTVKGSLPPGGLAPTTDAAFASQRIDRVLVIPFRFSADRPGTPPLPTAAQLREATFGATNSIRQYFLDSSHDNVVFNGDVQEPLTVNADPGDACNWSRWIDPIDAASKAAATPYDPASYDRVIYVSTAQPGCYYGGETPSPGRFTMSWVRMDGDATWATKGARWTRDIAHEMMHQFGLFHELAAVCRNAVSGLPAPISSDCNPGFEGTGSGTSDQADLMSGGAFPMTGAHRLATGMLPVNNVRDIDPATGAAVTLRSVDGGAATGGQPQILRIPRIAARAAGERHDYYYVESRAIAPTSNTFDGLPHAEWTINRGLAIRIGDQYDAGVLSGESHTFQTVYPAPGQLTPNNSRPWDARAYFVPPGTREGDYRDSDAWLRPGQSFYDPVGNFTITAGTRSGNTADVTVAPGPVPLTTQTKTTVAVTDGQLTVTAGSGRRNAISIGATGTGGDIYVADYGNRPQPGTGCTAVDVQTVRCTRNVVRSAIVNTGDGDDVIAVQGSDLTIPMTLGGGTGDDSIQGGAGDDLIDGGAGSDAITGGPGIDTITYAARTAAVTVAPAPDPPYRGSGDDPTTSISGSGEPAEHDGIAQDVENAIGGSGNDTFVTAAADTTDRVADGGLGADTFNLAGSGRRTVIALDGLVDATIACGAGTSDRLVADTAATAVAADPNGGGCETRTATVAPTLTSATVGSITTGSGALPQISQTTPTFAWTHPKPGTTFECKLESGSSAGSGAYSTCTSPYTTAALAAGTYTFSVRSQASGSIAASEAAASSFVVSTTAPTATFASGPADGASLTSRTPTYAFSGPAGASFQCKLASADWAACETPYTLPQQSGASATLSVRAVSASGTVQTAAAQSRTANFTAPLPTTTVTGPEHGATVTDDQPRFAFTGTAAAKFECWTDSVGGYQTCSSPYLPDLKARGVATGRHVVRIRAVDAYGNADPTPEVRMFTVVTGVKIFSPLKGRVVWSRTGTATLPFSVEQTGGAGVIHEQCSVIEGDWQPCSPPSFAVDLSAQPTDASYDFKVRVLDAANNVIARDTTYGLLRVDRTAPSAPIVSGIGSELYFTPAGVSVRLSSGDGASGSGCEWSTGNSCVGFDAQIDGGAWKAAAPAYASGPLTVGTHTVAFRAHDLAGNLSATSVSKSFTVKQPPSATVPVTFTLSPTKADGSPGAWTNTRTPSFTFAADAQGFNYRYQCLIRYPVWEDCTPGKFVSADVPGDYRHAYDAGVRVYDGSGAIVNDTSMGVGYRQAAYLVDYDVPQTAWTATPANGATVTGPSASLTFASPDDTSARADCASNFDGVSCVSFECKVNGGTYERCESPYVLTGSLNGAFTISVRARDEAGNIDPTPITRTYSLNLGSPPDTTITSGPESGHSTNLSAPSFAFAATPASGASFQCQFDTTTVWQTCASPKTVASGSTTTRSIRVRAVGANGAVDPSPASRSWYYDTTAPETSITASPKLGLVAPGGKATLSFAVSDPTGRGCDAAAQRYDCPTTQCRLDSGSWSACTSPHTTAALTEGSHSFAVRAVDEAGNADATPATTTLSAVTPAVAFTGGPADWATIPGRTPTYTFTVNLPTLQLQCSQQNWNWSGSSPGSSQDWKNCSSPWTLSGILATSNVAWVKLRAVDPADGTVIAPEVSRIVTFSP
ncbi:MAG: hypothetical protein QM679_05115 [Patulibacter sp.]